MDNRLFPGLDPSKTFLDERDIFLLTTGKDESNKLKIKDFRTSEIKKTINFYMFKYLNIEYDFFAMNTEVLFGERPFLGLNDFIFAFFLYYVTIHNKLFLASHLFL